MHRCDEHFERKPGLANATKRLCLAAGVREHQACCRFAVVPPEPAGRASSASGSQKAFHLHDCLACDGLGSVNQPNGASERLLNAFHRKWVVRAAEDHGIRSHLAQRCAIALNQFPDFRRVKISALYCSRQTGAGLQVYVCLCFKRAQQGRELFAAQGCGCGEYSDNLVAALRDGRLEAGLDAHEGRVQVLVSKRAAGRGGRGVARDHDDFRALAAQEAGDVSRSLDDIFVCSLAIGSKC